MQPRLENFIISINFSRQNHKLQQEEKRNEKVLTKKKYQNLQQNAHRKQKRQSSQSAGAQATSNVSSPVCHFHSLYMDLQIFPSCFGLGWTNSHCSSRIHPHVVKSKPSTIASIATTQHAFKTAHKKISHQRIDKAVKLNSSLSW